MTVARVLVDGPSRLGLLSYLVPTGLSLEPGDAVEVPFGSSSREGMVVELAGRDDRATREVSARLGSRADSRDVATVLQLASDHFSAPQRLLRLLSPSKHRDAPASDFGPLTLKDDLVPFVPDPSRNWSRRASVCPPQVPLADAVAQEAFRLASTDGQVLVLCPTLEWAAEVRRRFVSGAARLSSSSGPGVWTAWRRGRLQVAVGVRSAAWYSPKRLAGVVVLEDGHPGHRDLRHPYLSAVEVAAARTEALDVPLSFVSRVHSAQALGSRVKATVAEKELWPSLRLLDRSRFPASETLPSLLTGEFSRAASRSLPVLVVAESRPSVRRCSRCAVAWPCHLCSDSGCVHAVAQPCSGCASLSARWSGWDVARCRLAFPSAQALPLPEVARLPAASRLVLVPDVSRLAATPTESPTLLAGSVLLAAASAAGASGRLVVGCWDRSWLPLRLLASRDQLAFGRQVFEEAREAMLPPFGREVLLSFARRTPPPLPPLPGRVLGPFLRGDAWQVRAHVPESDWGEAAAVLGGLADRRNVTVRVL